MRTAPVAASKPKRAIGLQIERCRLGCRHRPGRKAAPFIGAGLEHGDRRHIQRRRFVLQIMRQHGRQHMVPPPGGGVLAELDRAQRRAFIDALAVIPGADRHAHHVVGVLGLQRFPHRHVAVDIFGIPQAAHQQHRHGDGAAGEDLVHRLRLPEFVIGRMRRHLVPEAHLLQAVFAAQFARRDGAQIEIVIVILRTATIWRNCRACRPAHRCRAYSVRGRRHCGTSRRRASHPPWDSSAPRSSAPDAD